MKKYIVKNYKGNIVESLSRFSKNHKDLKIVEVKEENKELKIKTEAVNHFGIPLRLYANFETDAFDPRNCKSTEEEYMGHASHTDSDGNVYTVPTRMKAYHIDYTPAKNFDLEKKWPDVILTIENASNSNKLTDAQLSALSDNLNNSDLGECIRKAMVCGLWSGDGAKADDKRPVMVPAKKRNYASIYEDLPQWYIPGFKKVVKELIVNGLMKKTTIKVDSIGIEFTPVDVREEIPSTIDAHKNYIGPFEFVEWEVLEPVAVKL